MDIREIKKLAQAHSAADLERLATEFEESGVMPADCSKEPEAHLSDLLQALEVRKIMDQGAQLNDAVRTFSARVRKSIS
jgi:hypothetical protein